MNKMILTWATACLTISAQAQDAPVALKATLNKQTHFQQTIAPGHYSGITWLGNNEYAVVNDKARADGFFIFHINTDPDVGLISHAYSDEFRHADRPNRDMEGIAFFPKDTTIFIAGEADNQIMEYKLTTGKRTGRRLEIPDSLSHSAPNYGFESLSYNAATHLFWTVSESTLPIDGTPATPSDKKKNQLRLLSFDEGLQLSAQYFYEMDMPELKSKTADNYCLGVSDVCALDDGRLIVMERELYAPALKFGSFVVIKLYVVHPTADKRWTGGEKKPLEKTLLTEFKTQMTGLKTDFANYEGLCLGPKLSDGRQLLVLICDSQNQYKGKLKDWLKTIIIE